MNQQREVIYSLRRDLMQLPDVEGVLFEFVDELLDNIYQPLEGLKEAPDADLCVEVNTQLLNVCNVARKLPEMTMSAIPAKAQAREAVEKIFQELHEEAGPVYGDILRYFLLEALDRCWKEHLRAMDYLREGIGLRGYAQRDPKREYQSEGLSMFKEMLFRIHENAVSSLTHVRMKRVESGEEAPLEPEEGEQVEERGQIEFTSNGEGSDVTSAEKTVYEEPVISEESKDLLTKQDKSEETINTLDLQHHTDPEAIAGTKETEHSEGEVSVKVGRNDPCPCGSGKKFKKCCGRNM
jgi:preprotein translocase subunit SecA